MSAEDSSPRSRAGSDGARASVDELFEPWEDWLFDPAGAAFSPLGERSCCRARKRRCGPPVQHAEDWVYAPVIRLAKGTGWLEAP